MDRFKSTREPPPSFQSFVQVGHEVPGHIGVNQWVECATTVLETGSRNGTRKGEALRHQAAVLKRERHKSVTQQHTFSSIAADLGTITPTWDCLALPGLRLQLLS